MKFGVHLIYMSYFTHVKFYPNAAIFFGSFVQKSAKNGIYLVRGANNHNTLYCYYISFKDNLGIVFPNFEVSCINDGSH